MPFGRKFMPQTEQTNQTFFPRRLSDGINSRNEFAGYSLLQIRTTVARGIADVQYDIRDGVVVESGEYGRQFDPPRRDHARTFERQIALVTDVCFKQAAIALAVAGDD